jgi:AcrR family transcriptional regulator
MIDRRVARTRALLHRAHLALIIEKGYEGATVEDICAAANVGRSTFYAHYPNKEALHRDGLEALRRQLGEHCAHAVGRGDGAHADRLAFSLPMFEHAREHLDVYRALIGNRGGVIALDSIRLMLSDIVRAALATEGGGPDAAMRREFVVRFLVGAYMAVMTGWLDDGARASPQEMDALFRQLVGDGLVSGVRSSPSGGSPAEGREGGS